MPSVQDSHKKQNRMPREQIAPRIWLTTQSGSMYTTLCKALARIGRLEQHDELFRTFQRKQTEFAAHRLLQQIGVARDELEAAVRSDHDFLVHCAKRTQLLQFRAVRGEKRAQQILRDPAICDARGRWIGDLAEGLNILSGGRSLRQVRRGKNLRILNRAGLMFDRVSVGEGEFCFLYKQKWHSAFKRAVALALKR